MFKAMNSRSWIMVVAAIMGLLGACTQVHAVSLPISSRVSLTDAGVALPAGSTQIATQSFNMNVTQVGSAGYTWNMAGTLTVQVYKETGGTVDFLYQFVNNSVASSGVHASNIKRFSVSNYTGYTTDVDNLSGSSGLYSHWASRSQIAGSGFNPPNNTAPVGQEIDFYSFGTSDNSGNGIAPGQQSMVIFVRTNATSYDSLGNVKLTDGFTHTVQNTFEPNPEPSSLALLGGFAVGLAGWGGWRRARRPMVV